MAENKKSFIAYVDWGDTFDALSDEKAGQLVKHLFAYVNDKNPQTDDILIKIAFTNIKNQLKRDLKKWENISMQRIELGRLGGIKSGKVRQNRAKQIEAKEAIALKSKQTEANGSKPKQNEHDTVTVTDNDNVNEEYKKKPNKSADFIDQVIDAFVRAHGNYEIINKGKEREMAGKILKLYKKKFPDSDSAATIEALSKYFHQCVNIQDQWLRNNMSLSIIVSKFNEINTSLRNGNKKGGGATNAELAAIVAKHFGDG